MTLPPSDGQSQRNCLENPNKLHFEIPGVGKTREEAPLLALCATENTGSRPIQLFSKQFLEEVFSETRFPVLGLLGI
jgi:hypothetical protein